MWHVPAGHALLQWVLTPEAIVSLLMLPPFPHPLPWPVITAQQLSDCTIVPSWAGNIPLDGWTFYDQARTNRHAIISEAPRNA